MHALGVADAILSIHNEAALDDVDDLAVMGDRHGARLFQSMGEIILLDDVPIDGCRASAIHGGHMRACHADQCRGNFHARRGLGLSTERVIACEAAARSTIIPFLIPSEGSMPTPRMRMEWLSSTRPTSVQTLVVPTSMPTTISSIGLLTQSVIRCGWVGHI